MSDWQKHINTIRESSSCGCAIVRCTCGYEAALTSIEAELSRLTAPVSDEAVQEALSEVHAWAVDNEADSLLAAHATLTTALRQAQERERYDSATFATDLGVVQGQLTTCQHPDHARAALERIHRFALTAHSPLSGLSADVAMQRDRAQEWEATAVSVLRTILRSAEAIERMMPSGEYPQEDDGLCGVVISEKLLPHAQGIAILANDALAALAALGGDAE